jgi:predicted nuclease of predicted toxin-antitoxin system
MRLLADECLDQTVVSALRAAGHDVERVAIGSGFDDDHVVTLAERTGRVLLTQDLDFGRIAVEERRPQTGLVLLRVEPPHVAPVAARLVRLLHDHPERVPGAINVIDEATLRTRRLGDPTREG